MTVGSGAENAADDRAPRWRIVLTGTYNSANKGDAAMELSALQAICERAPGSQVTILSPFPDLDAPFYAPISVRRCNRRNLVAATLDLFRAAVWRLLFGRSQRTNVLLSESLRLVHEADLVIDLSGDMLTEDNGLHVAYSHFIPLLRALILGRPYFVCAQSIGPFKVTRPLARHLIGRAAAVTVREAVTLDYLKNLGSTRTEVVLTADLAFLLPAASADRANEIARAEGIVLDDRLVLGVSISRLIETHYRYRNRNSQEVDFLSLIRIVIERLARGPAIQVIFFPHVTGPRRSKDDRVIAAELHALLGNAVSAAEITGDYRPEELKALIARCTVFLGARMHANIAALSSGIPVVAISYSHKTRGIMDSVGLGEFVAPVDSMTPNLLGGLLEQAFGDRDRIAAKLQQTLPVVQDRACNNAETIVRLLKTQGRLR